MIKGMLIITAGVGIAALVVWIIVMALSVDRYSGDTTAQWHVVTGNIIGFNASKSSSNDDAPSVMIGASNENWTVMVSFGYQVNGVTYTDTQMWIANESMARSQESKYRKGAVASVYYNPNNASSALIEPKEVYYNTFDRFVLPLLLGIPGLAFAFGFIAEGIGEIRRAHFLN